MYAVLQYTFDLEDLSTEFSHVVFVTKDISVAEQYKVENDDRYLGGNVWVEIHIKEVEEK